MKYKKVVFWGFSIFVLFLYKFLAGLYINPDNSIHRYIEKENQKVIDYIKLKKNDQLIYIYHTNNGLIINYFKKQFLGFWHCPYQSGTAAQYYPINNYLIYNIFGSGDDYILYGYCINENITEIRLICDRIHPTKDIIENKTLTYKLKNDSKLFYIELNSALGLFKNITIEVIDKNETIIFSEIILQNKVLNNVKDR